MLAESLPPWRPIEVHFCLLPARRAEKEESTFPVLFSFFFLLVKQSVLICRAASPHFAYLLAHTRSLVCVYVLRIPLLMFCVTERKQEVSLWVAPLKIPHETQMVTQTLTRYLGSLLFYDHIVKKLSKWNTVLLIYPTTWSGLVLPRDSNPSATGRIVPFLLGFPNIKGKKEEKEDGLFLFGLMVYYSSVTLTKRRARWPSKGISCWKLDFHKWLLFRFTVLSVVKCAKERFLWMEE